MPKDSATTEARNRYIRRQLEESAETKQKMFHSCAAGIRDALNAILVSYKKGGKVLLCGNGGSAADSQHLAAELVGRFKRERRALASVALTTDTSVLTCLANDYSYEDVFARQVEALADKNDLLIGLSTSGNSENVLRALRRAKSVGATTVGLLGRDGGKIKPECDHAIVVPSNDTARIQEMHIMIGHIVCDAVELAFA